MSNLTGLQQDSREQENDIVQEITLHFHTDLSTQHVSDPPTGARADYRRTKLRVELTWRRNNGSHGESISDAFSHGNNVGDNSVALKAPHVASRSPKSGLDLSGEKPALLSSMKRCCGLGCTGGAPINVEGIHLQNFHTHTLS